MDMFAGFFGGTVLMRKDFRLKTCASCLGFVFRVS